MKRLIIATASAVILILTAFFAVTYLTSGNSNKLIGTWEDDNWWTNVLVFNADGTGHCSQGIVTAHFEWSTKGDILFMKPVGIVSGFLSGQRNSSVTIVFDGNDRLKYTASNTGTHNFIRKK